MSPERRQAPRDPLDELLGLLHAARQGQLPTGLWRNRLTAAAAVVLSNAMSAGRWRD